MGGAVFQISQNTSDPRNVPITIDTSKAWHGNGKKAFSLDQAGTKRGVTTATSEDGAALTFNSDGSICYNPTGSSLLSILPLGETESDHFMYGVVVGNRVIETVNVSVLVTGTYVAPYVPTNHDYSPTLQSSDNSFMGSGLIIINQTTIGVLEFNTANIATHAVTAASLDLHQIGFALYDGGNSPFTLNIVAYNGTTSVDADREQAGTVIGTTHPSLGLGDLHIDLALPVINDVLSHGSNLGLSLVAVDANGAESVLDPGSYFGTSQLHLTA